MAWFNRLKFWDKKTSETARAILAYTAGQKAIWTPKDYGTFAREGFANNVYVYACVCQIAFACAGIPWKLYSDRGRGRKIVDKHPLLNLLGHPNPGLSRSEFIAHILSYLLIAGNSYIEAAGPITRQAPPGELYVLRPDRVKVVPGSSQQLVAGYIYTVGGTEIKYTTDDVLHIKLFNPTSDWYGMSPLESAARSVDQHNTSKEWNVALLQNSARPSGSLETEEALSDEQFERLQALIVSTYVGKESAGKPLLLEGGLKWKEMGLSPVDMAWLEGQNMSAKEIAIAFAVPPEMIGDNTNKTYNNYHEARKAFYEETVLPYMDMLCDTFNHWLVPKFDSALILAYDRDEILALVEDRQKLWASLRDAWWLTPNERRHALGYEKIIDPSADTLYIPQNLVPASARQEANTSDTDIEK